MTDTTEQETRATVLAALVADGLTSTAAFVPLSQSRNAGKKDGRGHPVLSLNWRVTLAYQGRSLTTDYMQGIGHLPGCARERTMATVGYEADAAEKGRRLQGGANGRSSITVALEPPALADVLDCLVMDATVLEYACYEDWSDGEGIYDKDSREGERVYRECLRLSLDLRRVLGSATLDRLMAAREE